jgi:hypothetical protein
MIGDLPSRGTSAPTVHRGPAPAAGRLRPRGSCLHRRGAGGDAADDRWIGGDAGGVTAPTRGSRRASTTDLRAERRGRRPASSAAYGLIEFVWTLRLLPRTCTTRSPRQFERIQSLPLCTSRTGGRARGLPADVDTPSITATCYRICSSARRGFVDCQRSAAIRSQDNHTWRARPAPRSGSGRCSLRRPAILADPARARPAHERAAGSTPRA